MLGNPFLARRQRLCGELDRLGLRGALLTDPSHVFYLSGLISSPSFPAYLAMNRDQAVVIAPQLGADSKWMPNDHTLEVMNYANLAMVDLNRYIDEGAERDRTLLRALASLGLQDKPLGIDGHHFPRDLGLLLNLSNDMLFDIGQFLLKMRVIKDEWEQEQLAFAVRVNDAGFAATQRALRPGMTDYEAFAAMWPAMAAMVEGDYMDIHGEFSGGPEISGQGGAYPMGQVLNEGDLLIADIYPVVRGYLADTTRTFVLGQPARWQLEMHSVLEEAMARGEEAMKPGLPASELDRIVRSYVEDHAPAGAHMFHHCGHGLGIALTKAGHWPPYIVPHSKDILQEGMVLTLEPGLYIPHRGGMRLEDNYVITKDGCRPLGTFPKKLAICENW